ncbi:hypothetical protein KTC96_23320 (plasmid) [Clostridium estertheticum]|uniref:hypothetical protein n=1 Tax=Clostridium estertheticum TaxID=238834 RepID=UPI001C7D2942|nr:hypothetical protein [Clostridium estertheticum]MBX4262792.1 hypothetical protein [Clostridium estertheticum]WLC72826.1 hypothetical protein KTC96_23320 [Clostridium estertheticum]
MKKRWFIYIIIGVLFGVFDFFYQEFTEGMATSYAMWFVVAWAIWLIPIIPVVIYEAKVSKSSVMSALANVLTWSVSTISYYLFIPIKLIFIGQATRIEMYISNYRDQFYWSNLKSILLGDVLSGIVRWIGVAIVGGFITGFLISFIYLSLRKIRNVKIDL